MFLILTSGISMVAGEASLEDSDSAMATYLDSTHPPSTSEMDQQQASSSLGL